MEAESFKGIIERIYDLLNSRNHDALQQILEAEEIHTLAAVLDRLDSPAAIEVFAQITPERQAEVIIFVQSHTEEVIVDHLTDDEIFAFLEYNDEDDATDVLQYVSEDRRQRILDQFGKSAREKIQKLLNFDADTAGGLMDAHYVIVKPAFTVEDVGEKIHNHFEANEQVPLVLVASEKGVIIGYISHRSLILRDPSEKVADIVEDVEIVSVTSHQEDLLSTIQRSSHDFLVVVDEKQRPIGVVHVKDLLRIAQQEATEDIYKFAGVQEEESPFDGIQVKVRKRYRWLIINLATSFLAAWVVSLFEDSISQLAILAIFMPIVAGQGGNAATQALAVAVRGFATQNITWGDARLIIVRESIAGVYNGLITGAIAAVVALFFGASPMLGVVLAAAMIANLFIAGLFGTLTPFVLRALRFDPATASTIFVTTFTDVFGFLAFLGLATIVLL